MAESYIVHYLSISRPAALLIVFIGMMIEGDILLFTAAFMSAQGLFNPIELFAVVLAGVMAGDYTWYLAGVKFLPKFPRIRRWVERITSPVDEHLRHRQFHTFAVSKFAYNMHHPILMRAGMLGLNRKKFIIARELHRCFFNCGAVNRNGLQIDIRNPQVFRINIKQL